MGSTTSSVNVHSKNNSIIGGFRSQLANQNAPRSSVKMMAVAAGAPAVEPTISGEAYTKMIENYMDTSNNQEYHEMANAIRFLSMDATLLFFAKYGHDGDC